MSQSTRSQMLSEALSSRGFGSLFAFLKRRLESEWSGFHVPLSERRLLLSTIDTLLIVFSLWLANFISISTLLPDGWQQLEGAGWMFLSVPGITWLLLAHLNDLYDIPSSTDRVASVLRILSIAVFGFAICGAISLVSPVPLPWALISTFIGVSTFLLIPWRLSYAKIARALASPHRVLVIGSESRADTITHLFQTAAPLLYEVLGFVPDRPSAVRQKLQKLLEVEQDSELVGLTSKLAVDEIIVATENGLTSEMVELLARCQGQGVQISTLPDVYEKICRMIPVQFVDPTWALMAMRGQPLFSRVQLVIKRLLDLAIVSLSLPILGLLLPLVALAVRLDSPGPIFYRQTRSGRGGAPFSIMKFRTMRVDAEKSGAPQWAAKNDARVTRVGRFLRKTHIDELPQLLNILNGDMSIVGPRPERPEFVAQLQKEIPFYDVRLTVKPGLTGWAQIHQDYGSSVEDALLKLQYDFYYIRYWSLWLDIYTMFKTIYKVFGLRGRA